MFDIRSKIDVPITSVNRRSDRLALLDSEQATNT